MKYYKVNYSTVIKTSKERLWTLMAERFGEIAKFSKSVEKSEYGSDQRAGVGTSRYRRLSNDGFIKETITIWEEHKEFEFEIEETTMPVENGSRINFKFSSQNGKTTNVNVEGIYRLKHLPFLSPVIKPMMLRTIREMISDFEQTLVAEN